MVGSSVSRARTLRRSMTGVELLLWSRLRLRQLGGHRFRRQAPIGPYVADFACFQARLLIEIDGPTHDDRAQPTPQSPLPRHGRVLPRLRGGETLSSAIGPSKMRLCPPRNRLLKSTALPRRGGRTLTNSSVSQ